ncbi:MAG TPA: thiamine pyrophosphate-binding protein [Syntrophorhabdaceae bacterium]|jgi:thiamine pyrophosphate-dependent acetolactate synthase large subunit-like protein
MLGKDAILHFFEKKGIKNLFHLPGIHTLPFNEAITKNPRILSIRGRHESTLASMADGYARATGEAGILIVTPGPGLGNVVSGCMEAFSDDVPLLIIHIDTGRKDIGKGILHELVEPEAIFRHITKKTFCVSIADELIPLLDDAFCLAMAERRGPVMISIPYTLFEKEVPFTLPARPERQERLDLDEIEHVLAGKKHPVIIGGKGLMREELRPLLESLCVDRSIPFLTTTAGKGVLSEYGPCAFGNIMQRGTARRILDSADVVIALGTRLRDVDAKRRGIKIKDLIHIDTNGAWMGKNYAGACVVSGDLNAALVELHEVLGRARFNWDLEGLKRQQEEERSSLERDFMGFHIMKAVREAIPLETVTVWDLSLLGYWAEYYFPVEFQRTFIMPRGISPIFYALPAGIGARVGRPDTPCLAICGDGSFLPSSAELAVIREYNIPLVTIVYNNRSYGILEDYMESSYGIKGSMGLTNPDFVKLAGSFGIEAKRVTDPDRLKDTLCRLRWDEPCLIEFDFPIFPSPWK